MAAHADGLSRQPDTRQSRADLAPQLLTPQEIAALLRAPTGIRNCAVGMDLAAFALFERWLDTRS